MSASGGGTSSGGVVTWTLGTIAAAGSGQQTAVLQVASTAAAGSQLAADAAVLNPTTGAALVHAALTTDVGSAAVTALTVNAAATPNPVAPGQTVSYSVKISNTAAATHSVSLRVTVPVNTTVSGSGLSPGAYCDGVASFGTCAAGQTLLFTTFNVTAGGNMTVTYPALVSTTTPPANGTLLNSDVWVDDLRDIGDEYQTNVAAVAQSGASANPPQRSSAALAQVLNGGALGAVQSPAAAGRRAGSAGAGSSSAAHASAATRQQYGSLAAGTVGTALSADTRVIVALDDTIVGAGKAAANSRWPSDLGQRLQSEGDTSRPITVKQSSGAAGLPGVGSIPRCE